MTDEQKKAVVIAFAETESEEQFDEEIKLLGLDAPEYEEEIADLLFSLFSTSPTEIKSVQTNNSPTC
ncbi:hypothetical protein H6F44_12675 [Pseudanabaena sp. FACHB-1277]|uniref:Uncharacterized protein n=1 Tax=Pseudanabaena cinerea FACHB-1277 TaxID=2949581 RepID=A0A926Z643_9CYAN|nr:hypothetical protein [Pseudanabaena cinerea]MBD2150966.1 hypothetical protein [Pseudanabaena cinerea FACHB-1277]